MDKLQGKLLLSEILLPHNKVLPVVSVVLLLLLLSISAMVFNHNINNNDLYTPTPNNVGRCCRSSIVCFRAGQNMNVARACTYRTPYGSTV